MHCSDSELQGVVKCIQQSLLPKPYPNLPMVQPAPTNKALGTKSQWNNCSTIRRGNAAEHACPESKRWQHHHHCTT
jgi:hypothetical protein